MAEASDGPEARKLLLWGIVLHILATLPRMPQLRGMQPISTWLPFLGTLLGLIGVVAGLIILLRSGPWNVVMGLFFAGILTGALFIATAAWVLGVGGGFSLIMILIPGFGLVASLRRPDVIPWAVGLLIAWNTLAVIAALFTGLTELLAASALLVATALIYSGSRRLARDEINTQIMPAERTTTSE